MSSVKIRMIFGLDPLGFARRELASAKKRINRPRKEPIRENTGETDFIGFRLKKKYSALPEPRVNDRRIDDSEVPWKPCLECEIWIAIDLTETAGCRRLTKNWIWNNISPTGKEFPLCFDQLPPPIWESYRFSRKLIYQPVKVETELVLKTK